jgi:predicted lipid carrier protein YhbT
MERRTHPTPNFPGLALNLPLARAILQQGLVRLVHNTRKRHPEIMDRMGVHRGAIFLIDAVDLPVVFRLHPEGQVPLSVLSRKRPGRWDSRICGTLANLVALIEGNLDGDALFFSGDISVEGSTEAILALRNAIDAAEIDFISEAAACLGPLEGIAAKAARAIQPAVSALIRNMAPVRRKEGFP